MSAAQAAARHQQSVEALCAAAIRALSGEPDLHFRARRLHRGQRALPLFGPHLLPSLELDDFSSFRGAADGMALRLLHSDAVLHRALCPAEALERWVFELLEQLRVEALAPQTMAGVTHNLRHRFEAWSMAFHASGHTDTAQGLLLFTIAQVCRSRLTGQPVPEEIEDLLESTRAGIVPLIGVALAGLRRERDCQAAYAEHALVISRFAGEQVRAAEVEQGGKRLDEATEERHQRFSLLIDFDSEPETGIASVALGQSRVLDEAAGGYRIFTKAYDRERRAATLARPEQFAQYREQLDRRIAEQGVNVSRLARQLKALLAAPAHAGWEGGQEEGRIDGRRLAMLVSAPAEQRIFLRERIEPLADAAATFLIDCSGSMKQHIEAVAVLVDVFVRALEQAGVPTEVLGFTTGAWHGGRAQRDWQRAGRPHHPGRLNEAEHLIFKDADTPWRRARHGIAALLKADLFREGIDGEAVLWASRRLDARSEARRLLFVISDGCPHDGATALANDAHYLDQHLREEVAKIERQGRIHIFGIGVGLDLSSYYGRSQALELNAAPGNAACREIVAMMARRGRR